MNIQQAHLEFPADHHSDRLGMTTANRCIPSVCSEPRGQTCSFHSLSSLLCHRRLSRPVNHQSVCNNTRQWVTSEYSSNNDKTLVCHTELFHIQSQSLFDWKLIKAINCCWSKHCVIIQLIIAHTAAAVNCGSCLTSCVASHFTINNCTTLLQQSLLHTYTADGNYVFILKRKCKTSS